MITSADTKAPSQPGDDVLLRLDNLTKWFPIRRGLMRRVVGYIKAVDGINLELYSGETLGLVGESGCGKTTLVHTLLRLEQPTRGSIGVRLDGGLQDITTMSRAELRQVRRHVQLVFQNPAASMSPRMSVFDIVSEPLKIHGIGDRASREKRVQQLLEAVGLNPYHMRRFPQSFSGGQQQRIGIARALALGPSLIIADEPVSALDVSVQSQILNLFNDLKQRFDLTYLFIAHNLNVVKYLSDRIAVMYLGQIVELGPPDGIYASPKHPYTESLLSAIPVTHPRWRDDDRTVLEGELPDPADPPSGCRFHPRCPYAEDRCKNEQPTFREVESGRFVACHLADDLTLKGGARA